MKKILKWVLIIVVVSVIVVAAINIIRIVYNPSSLFVEVKQQEKPEITAIEELSPYEQLVKDADRDIMKNIVNVLIIGVDYSEERETWSGKHDYHADVMMICAINFDENKVDLISIPRDTYAKIPGVEGIYKINASLNCGGGFPQGLNKVCEAASWMIGGIPVDYYYAVTMPVVKELVDTIGGVDFDLKFDFQMAGRSYKAGQQHMDGQAVLDFLRVRKNIKESGDANRVKRQKEMLVTLFRKMKSQNLLVNIPEYVKMFDGKLLTNTDISQTAALALFGYNLDEENISAHSIVGNMTDVFNWTFCLTNQKKRVKLIKDVYGIDVPQDKEYSRAGACIRWIQMELEFLTPNFDYLIKRADEEIANDIEIDMTEATVPPDEPTPTQDEDHDIDDDNEQEPVVTEEIDETSKPEETAEPIESEVPEDVPKYDREIRLKVMKLKEDYKLCKEFMNKKEYNYENDEEAVNVLGVLSRMKESGKELVDIFGLKDEFKKNKLKWTYEYEKDFNEIYVDFR